MNLVTVVVNSESKWTLKLYVMLWLQPWLATGQRRFRGRKERIAVNATMLQNTRELQQLVTCTWWKRTTAVRHRDQINPRIRFMWF